MTEFRYIATNEVGEEVSGTLQAADFGDVAMRLLEKGYQVKSVQVAGPHPTPPPLAGEGISNDATGLLTESQDSRGSPDPATRSGDRSHQQADLATRSGDRSHQQPLERTATAERTVEREEIPRYRQLTPQPFKKRHGRLSPYILAPFYRQFAVLYKAGVPMQSSLESLAKQTRSPRLSRIVLEIQRDVLSGISLTDSMARHSPAFSDVDLSIMRSAEHGGFVDRALVHLADYMDHEIELRRILRSALFYPVATIVVAVFVFILLCFVMGPEIFGDWVTNPQFWMTLGIAIVALFVGFRSLMQVGGFRLAWEHVLLSIPFLGNTRHMTTMVKFGRALGALYQSGVALPSALRLASDASGSDVLRVGVYEAAQGIESGVSISESLGRTGVMSPMMMDMIRTGENTGELDQMLEKVADFSEEEAKVRIRQSGISFGILVYIVAALMVLYILLKAYSGYFAGIFKAAQ